MEVTKIVGKTINFPQLRGFLGGLHYPVMAEIKYDGEFNYLHYFKKETYLVNKYGTVKKKFLMLDEIGKVISDSGASSATLVCEVYWAEGKLGALYELLAHKQDDACKIKLFDIIELNGESKRQLPYLDRIEAMQEMELTPWLAKCWVANNKQDVERIFKEVTNEGYEGIAVKSLNSSFVSGPCGWVKMKYKDQSNYEVTLVDLHRERIEIAAPNHHGNTYVGVKCAEKYKKFINVGDMVTIEHQGVLSSGSLRHPVLVARKEWK